MEKEKLESLLIDYIDGKLNSVDKHFIEQELMQNPTSFRMYQELKEVIRVMGKVSPVAPSSDLRDDFNAMLERESQELKAAKVVAMRPWWYAVAAGLALLITGLSIGLFINNRNHQAEELALLEEKKAHTNRVVSALSDQQSPAKRILAVKEASAVDDLNDEIVRTLIRTMDSDPNTNVRLAAIEALSQLRDDPVVRKALVASLAKQSDPVVQIPLIKLIVELRDKEAVEPLRHVVENEANLESVKDEAQLGLLVLS